MTVDALTALSSAVAHHRAVTLAFAGVASDVTSPTPSTSRRRRRGHPRLPSPPCEGVMSRTPDDVCQVFGSGLAAVSWGPNRIDVFVRGLDNAIWRIWYDQRWSS